MTTADLDGPVSLVCATARHREARVMCRGACDHLPNFAPSHQLGANPSAPALSQKTVKWTKIVDRDSLPGLSYDRNDEADEALIEEVR